MILDLHADSRDGSALGCDTCPAVCEPGELSTPRGPWNARMAQDAAETLGWIVTDGEGDMCPGCVSDLDSLLTAMAEGMRS